MACTGGIFAMVHRSCTAILSIDTLTHHRHWNIIEENMINT